MYTPPQSAWSVNNNVRYYGRNGCYRDYRRGLAALGHLSVYEKGCEGHLSAASGRRLIGAAHAGTRTRTGARARAETTVGAAGGERGCAPGSR